MDDDDFGENYGADNSFFLSLSFFLQIEARRKEVSDLERQLLKEKRKSDAFEKTVIAISDEWNQLQSAFETLLSQQKEEDDGQKRSNNNNRRQFDAFRRLLLKNVSEEDEAAFEKEFNPPRAKKKRKRGDGGDGDGDTATREDETMEEDGEEESDEDEEVNATEEAKFLADLKSRAAKTKERFASAVIAAKKNPNATANEKKTDYLAADALRAKRIANALRATKAKMEEKLKENEELLETRRLDVMHLRRRIEILQYEGANPGEVDKDLGIKLATKEDAKLAGAKAQMKASEKAGGPSATTTNATAGAGAALTTTPPSSNAPTKNAETESKQLGQLKADLGEAVARFKMSEKLLADMREKNAKIESELKAVKNQGKNGASEAVVLQSPLYTALSQQLEILKTESTKFDTRLEQTKRENDKIKTRNLKLEIANRDAQAQEEKLNAAENYSRELKSFLERANKERDEAEKKISEAVGAEKGKGKDTEESAQALLKIVQQQMEAFKNENEKLKKARTERDEAKEQNRTFETQVKSLEAKVATLEKKAASKSKTLEKDLAAVTAELKQEKENRERLENETKEKSDELDQLAEELGGLASMADEATEYGETILQKLSDKEDEVNKMKKEAAAAQREAKKYYDDYEQVRMSNEKDKVEAKAATEKAQKLEADVEKLTKELETAKSEARGAFGAGSSDKLRIEQLETDLTKLKSQLSIVESRCNQLSSDEAKLQKEIKKLEKERDDLKIENAGVKKKCDLLSREGGAGALQEEIDAYKTMMGCNVCKQRDKACVITKCFHMFCRECIDTRIATRQRKCPGCALAFSENDVQNIYF